jgi:GNAT superfamily N-acetyltransferase
VTDIEIRPTPFTAPVAQTMVAAAMAEMGARYGGSGDDSPIDATEFDAPGGAFFVAYRSGEPVGCAGWRTYDANPATAELKRMYVSLAGRGVGVATALLAVIEESAAGAGRNRIILECGDKQPEAIALYEKLGYQRIPDFGYYRAAPGVRSYGRDIGRVAPAPGTPV